MAMTTQQRKLYECFW